MLTVGVALAPPKSEIFVGTRWVPFRKLLSKTFCSSSRRSRAELKLQHSAILILTGNSESSWLPLCTSESGPNQALVGGDRGRFLRVKTLQVHPWFGAIHRDSQLPLALLGPLIFSGNLHQVCGGSNRWATMDNGETEMRMAVGGRGLSVVNNCIYFKYQVLVSWVTP